MIEHKQAPTPRPHGRASSRTFEERRFQLSTGEIAALHFPTGHAGAPRVLALHGWLDNAGSFITLADALPELEIVAVDLCGHGHSAWRPPMGSYALIDHLPDLRELQQRLDWAKVVVVGHSMGAAIASLYAVAAPEQVCALICIDGLGPMSLDEAEAPSRLRRALAARSEPHPRRRLFASIDDAIVQRAHLNRLSPHAVAPLVERGLRAVEGGWVWAADPRLQLPSALPMSEAQVQSLLRAICQPTLVLAASDPDPRLPRLNVQARVASVPQARFRTLMGGHHLHLAEPESAAAEIRDFLKECAGAPC